jgi:hypothetical protein
LSITYGNTGDIKVEDLNMRWFVYGEPGSGKTFLGGTMPSSFFVWLPTETGKNALAMMGRRVNYAIVETEPDIRGLFADIANGKIAAANRSIVFDSLTDLTDLIIKQVLLETGKIRMDRNTWGVAVDHLRMIVTEFNSLVKTKHILMIAKSTIIKDEVRGDVFGVPDTIGKFAHAVGGLYDEVFYAEQFVAPQGGKKKKFFQLHTVKFMEKFPAKDSSGKLDVIEPNDFSIIYKKICRKEVQVTETPKVETVPPGVVDSGTVQPQS